MYTCNIIFWSVVVPSVLYSSAIWLLDDGYLKLIEACPTYV